MLKRIIEMTTEEGDVVLDPFAGSGVTGAEAVKLGREAILIEKNPEVAETITKPRVEKALKEIKGVKDVLESRTVQIGHDTTYASSAYKVPDHIYHAHKQLHNVAREWLKEV